VDLSKSKEVVRVPRSDGDGMGWMDVSIYGKLAGWWWVIQFKDKC